MRQVYIKESACIGCHLCEVYCRLKHARSGDLVKAYKKESPRSLPRLRVDEWGIVSLSVRCQHCEPAPCIHACLTGAMSRDPLTSLVTVDEERCIGCGTCALVCPLGVPRLDTVYKKMVKCDLCQDEEIPVCVANCPNEALQYAEINSTQPEVALK
jgi:anaerobic carbon-monoxide dehydrogenase iron sulfur subunit